MDEFSAKETEERKRVVLQSMSPRRRRHILKKGYQNWDPFQEPKDPIDIRRDKSRRTTQTLVEEFLQTHAGEKFSNAYQRGVLEIALGLINNDERFRGMYEFSCWYRELLQLEGFE